MAEFAVVLPALLFVAAVGMWAVSVCVEQLTLQTSVAAITRTATRGDSVVDQVRAADALGIHVVVEQSDMRVTVQGTREVAIPLPALHKAMHLSTSTTALREDSGNG